jgi:hypothetical protein
MLLSVLAVGVLGWPGCGGGSSGGGNNKVTGSSQPQSTLLIEQNWTAGVGEANLLDVEITGTGSGTVDATVEWTFATDDVDIYVTAQGCSIDMLAANQCAYKTKADSTTTKPEKVTFSVSGGDKYRFWIVNFGPQAESGTFTAHLTR